VILHAQPGGAPRLAVVERARIDTRRPIDFHAAVAPETVYVGQQATYQVGVFLSEDARMRLRRNPELVPPELRGVLAYEVGTPIRIPPQVVGGGLRYEAHVFQRALFPVASGTLRIPSPQLSYALPQSSSYFSREERFAVRAESAQLVVRPLPDAGRPPAFTGAVGRYAATARLDSATARVGDPLLLTVRVAGTGNVKLLPRPPVEIEWARVVPGSERLEVDTTTAVVRGAKEFDWILTPLRAGPVELPSLAYVFFDPATGRYAEARTEPRPVRVVAGALVEVAEDEPGAALALRPWRATERASPGTGLPVPRALLLLAGLLAAGAPLPALVLWRRRRRGGDEAAPGSHRPASQASAVASADAAVRDARRVVHHRLGARLGAAPGVLADRRSAARLLRRRGVTPATAEQVLALLARLDEGAYGGGQRATLLDAARLSADADALLRLVDGEAVPTGSPAKALGGRSARGAALGLLAALSMAMVPLLGAPSQAQAEGQGQAPSRTVEVRRTGAVGASLRAEVAAAADAYARRHFADAAVRFGSLVARRPADPDLLVNWGTAAWAAGDTVTAVVAWHRAWRVEPFAADVQARVALLPAGATGGVADVPLVPVPLLGAAALLAWLAGWSGLALAAWRPAAARPGDVPGAPADRRRWASLVAVVAGLVLAAAAAWGWRARNPEALAVVRRPETMRGAPGGDADAVGGVATGDVVRLGEMRDGWRRVRHADGRDGWLPDARLRALTVPTADR
jgi:hypothetical protein